MENKHFHNVQEILGQARRRRRCLPSAAFSAVLASLLTLAAGSYVQDLRTPLSGAQMIALRGLVELAGQRQELPKELVWQRLHDRFRVDSPIELMDGDFEQSVRFLATMIEAPSR